MYEKSLVKIKTSEFSTMLHGQVLEFAGDYLLISCLKMWPQLECHMSVYITICDNLQGKIFYSARVDKVLGERVWFSDLRLLQRKQERKEVRANVSIPLSISKLVINGNQEIKLDKIIYMETLDLSASGTLLLCSLNLPEHLGFEVLLRIDGSVILVRLQIVRKQQRSDGNYLYGCKFLNLQKKDSESLRQFVFKRQLQEKRKQRQHQIFDKLDRTS